MYLRNLIDQLLVYLLWRTSKRRIARGLLRFSVTEADSAWQIMHALDTVDNPVLRAKLFENILEEVHHSSEFEKVSSLFSDTLLLKSTLEREPLFNVKEGLESFLIYVHVGEKDVYEQFLVYEKCIGVKEVQNVIKNIIQDERGHVAFTNKILLNSLTSKKQIRRKIQKIRFKRTYESWLRLSKLLGEGTFEIVLSIIYYLCFIFIFTCRKRLRKSYEYENKFLTKL